MPSPPDFADEEPTKPAALDPLMSRHATIGALVEKFYREQSASRRAMIDGFLPAQLVELLRETA